MISSNMRLRIPISALAALSVAITFTLSSFAAPDLVEKADAAAQVQPAQTGTLTASGPVTVNGNQATTGMTILTGSVISVGAGGHAVIELGPLGRVDIAQGTTITLQILGNTQESAMTQCGDVTVTVPIGITGRVTIPQPRAAVVRVSQGKVNVKYETNHEKVLVAGNKEGFDNLIEVASDGGAAVFEVYCVYSRLAAAGWLPFSPWWLLLAIPAGVGVGVGVTREDEPPPVLSPVIPG